jgi:hypothetical protein
MKLFYYLSLTYTLQVFLPKMEFLLYKLEEADFDKKS